MSIQNTSRLIVDASNEAWNEAIEKCTALAQRWSDEAAEFKDSERCVIQANVCRNLAVAIRNLARTSS